MAVRVYVGTTAGPVEVQKITREEPGIDSLVCLDGQARILPISPDYANFVARGSGVIEKMTGHSAYRIDVDSMIDQGQSWQLAFYVAHVLEQAGQLAQPNGDCELAIWLTGEVRQDLKVASVEEVGLKIHRSQPLFERCQQKNVPIRVFFPANDWDPAQLNLKGVECFGVNHVSEVLAEIDDVVDPQDPFEFMVSSFLRRHYRTVIPISLALLLSVLGAAAVVHFWFAAPLLPNPIPQISVTHWLDDGFEQCARPSAPDFNPFAALHQFRPPGYDKKIHCGLTLVFNKANHQKLTTIFYRGEGGGEIVTKPEVNGDQVRYDLTAEQLSNLGPMMEIFTIYGTGTPEEGAQLFQERFSKKEQGFDRKKLDEDLADLGLALDVRSFPLLPRKITTTNPTEFLNDRTP